MTPFNIYNSDQQWKRWNECNRFPLLCGPSHFLPFQLGTGTPGAIYLVEVGTSNQVLLPATKLAQNTNWYYDGRDLDTPLTEGSTYYMQCGIWKSDYVKIVADSMLRTKITAASSIAVFGYDFTNFSFWVYLREDVKMTESEFVEKLLQSNSKNFYAQQVCYEKIQLDFVGSEQLLRGIAALRLFDAISIADRWKGDVYALVDRLDVKTDKDVVKCTLTMKYRETVVNVNGSTTSTTIQVGGGVGAGASGGINTSGMQDGLLVLQEGKLDTMTIIDLGTF